MYLSLWVKLDYVANKARRAGKSQFLESLISQAKVFGFYPIGNGETMRLLTR